VKKPNQRGPVSSASLGALAARAAEALKQQRFKEAVELFKPMIRQDPRPEWKQSLAEAYRGRARALAAKKMFKEAAMVVENTLGPDGTLADPVFYLHCLIRDGQHQKAAAHVRQYVGTESTCRRMPTGPDSCWRRFRRDRRSLPSARRWRRRYSLSGR
jgi:tetratricopeptide (TPR) repeat protein